MNMSAIKFFLAIMVLGLAAGCGKSDQPNPGVAITEAPVGSDANAAEALTPSVSKALVMRDYDASTAPAAGGNCALDAINGGAATGASVRGGTEVMFGGWIADANEQVPAEARLVLKGAGKAYSTPLVAGAERLDVAAALEAEALKLSGFNVLAMLDVVPGTYELFIIHGSEDTAASCSLNVSLMVAN